MLALVGSASGFARAQEDDAFAVVAFMAHCGWVHRDISAGNVYHHEGHGMVGDLEYAREIGSGARDSMRTVRNSLS